MITGSVFENQISRLWKRAFERAMQLVIYFHKGNPDNYAKGVLRDIEMDLAEIRKVQGETENQAGRVGIADPEGRN